MDRRPSVTDSIIITTAQLRQQADPQRLLPTLTSGLVGGVMGIFAAVSFAALIFGGSIPAYVPAGVSLVLLSAVAVNVVTSLATSVPGTLASPQDFAAAILALIAAGLAAAMPAGSGGDQTYYTIVAAMALGALLVGIVFLALGFFRLGGLVRFVPYPVVGGFLAGSGWLLLVGALSVMMDRSIDIARLDTLFRADALRLWLPGLILGVALLVGVRRGAPRLFLPGMLIGATGLFFAFLLVSGTSVEEASALGLMLGPFEDATAWRPLTPAALSQVAWPAMVSQAGNLLSLVALSVLGLLLNAAGLELALKRDVDLDRELRASGLANLLAGLGGGHVGFTSVSMTVLGHSMGGKSRVAGLIMAVVCGAVLLVGVSVIDLFPRFVLGGLLLFVAGSFLVEWLYDAWFQLSKSEYAILLVILGVIASVGFLEGIGVGVLAAAALFVVNYSRVNVVTHTLSGALYHSSLHRPGRHLRVLRQHGESLYILKLQGYLFFGTANRLLRQVQWRALDAELPPLRHAVLDFSRVTGLDSSAVLSFRRLKQLAESQDFRLVLTDLSPEATRLLRKGLLNEEGADGVVRVFPDLDHGVEWCEEQVLAAEHAADVEARTLRQQLDDVLPDSVDLDRLLAYMEKMEVPGDHTLIRQGEFDDCLYFLESGRVTVWLTMPTGERMRMRSMAFGSVLGEMGLYLRRARTASVITDRPSTVYRLTHDAILRMQDQDPALAAEFHQFIAILLAGKLTDAHNTLQAVLD